MLVTTSSITTKALKVEVLKERQDIHMITATLIVAYGAVAGLIGLTIEDYKKSARSSYSEEIE